MRTFANFLLFEDVLTNLPDGSNAIKTAANTLMVPTVNIVEPDCGTLLGVITPVSYALKNQIRVGTAYALTIPQITQLMTEGIVNIRIRSLHSCISKNGVCSACYESEFGVLPRLLDGTWTLNGQVILNGYQAYLTGTSVSIPSEFIYKTDIIIGDGINSTYQLSQTPDQYLRNSYDPILDPEVLSITGATVTFTRVWTPNDIFVLNYYNLSSNPFLEYMAKSYSGGLLGISPLPSYPTKLKPSLYQTMFSDSQISVLRTELDSYRNNIAPQYLEYCDTIRDPLEKILFIIYLYAIFANIS